MSNERLRMRFAILAADYIEVFSRKQGIDFDGWVGDEIGGVACFGDFFFNYDQIRYDIDHNIRKGTIVKWYYADTEHNIDREERQHINYSSWCKGLRHKDLNKKRRFTAEEKVAIEALREKVDAQRKEFLDSIKDNNILFCMKCDRLTEHCNGVCTECNN